MKSKTFRCHTRVVDVKSTDTIEGWWPVELCTSVVITVQHMTDSLK